MRQTNKENRFSSNKANRREKNDRSVCLINTHDFSRSRLCDFLFLLLSVYIDVQYGRKAVTTNVDQKADLLYIYFLSTVDITAIIDAERHRANTFIYVYIYIYRRQIIFPKKEGKYGTTTHSTTKPHLYTPPQISFSDAS